jgi:alpha-amylase
MKTICFYFQIHQPFRLKRYRFFDIGNDHYYYDDFNNENIMQQMVEKSYLPANTLLLEMIGANKGKFRVAFSISGTALDQLERHAPEVIDSFRLLAKTDCVEFLAETYAHSLACLEDPDEFRSQVERHAKRIETLFGKKPKAFRNTELIYSDEVGQMVADMGYKTIITEGPKHILGWKSPNYIYQSALNPNLKMLLKNSKLSDDISFRFSNRTWGDWPLTAEKFIDWVRQIPDNEPLVNLFMNYETFGNMQSKESGIFEFLRALPRFAEQKGIVFSTPSEIASKLKPVEALPVPYPISWADEERDVSAWLGNSLQQEAFKKLYSIGERVRMSKDRRLLQDWLYLQTSDHFFYMSTKHSSDGLLHQHFSPYESPFDAFTNYMNVLSDFIKRVNAQFPSSVDNEELNSLLTTIQNQEKTIQKLEDEVKKLKVKKAKPKKIVAPLKTSSSQKF